MAPRKVNRSRKVKRKPNTRKVTKPKKVKKLFTIVCMDGKCRVYRVFETKKRRFVVMTKKGKKTVYCIRKGHPVYKSRPVAVRAAKKVIKSPATCKTAAKKQKMAKQPAVKGRKAMKDFVDSGKGAAKKIPVTVKDAVSGRATDTFKLPSMADIRKRLTGGKSTRSKFGAKRRSSIEHLKYDAKKYGVSLKKKTKSGKMVSKTEKQLAADIFKKIKSKKNKTVAEKAIVTAAMVGKKTKMTPAQKARLKKAMKALVIAGGAGLAGKKAYSNKKKKTKRTEPEVTPLGSVFGRRRRTRRPINYGFGQFL